MRILHLHETARFVGGVERILHDTAVGLREQGLEQALLHWDAAPDADFLTPFSDHDRHTSLLERFEPNVILAHKVPSTELLRTLSAQWPTLRMVHDHDLVCLRRHKYFPLSGRLCEAPAGIACYRHLCCINRNRNRNGFLPLTLNTVHQQKVSMGANDQVRRFIVGSRWMRQSLIDNGFDPNRMSVIHPIPAALAHPRALPPSGRAEILYVGQIIRGKGVDLLLRALAITPGAWHATIAGEGSQIKECRALARRLGLKDRVSFLGQVPHAALEAHYARACFSVVPSRWPEPFGMVGIEAMARGRAVVGFDAGGIRDWLCDGETGNLVPAGNITGLATAMAERLSQAQATADMGARAARRVVDQFSHQRYLQQMRDVMEAAA